MFAPNNFIPAFLNRFSISKPARDFLSASASTAFKESMPSTLAKYPCILDATSTSKIPSLKREFERTAYFREVSSFKNRSNSCNS